ncbi:MAG TPA: extracellular solute-binding protein, partial [Mycobacteriales bacterium]|nr:extracellular solute-binding protein [Mycobacteriales bacterium]
MPRVRVVLRAALAAVVAAPLLAGCGSGGGGVTLHWYVGQEASGSYREAAQRCTDASAGRYRISLEPLPSNADAQRQLVVRRLAARDRTVDLIGMDVIWTAEFAEAGWLRPWVGARAARVAAGVLAGPLATARYRGVLWAAPFTSNSQLLWYRKSRTGTVPATWDQLITA